MYAATVEDQPLTFEVHGVWRKNMIVQDRETGTIWQQATGRAEDGPLAGRQLEVLPAWETTWGELKASTPEATFILEPETFTGLMPKPVLERALHITQKAALSGLAPTDKRLPQHEIVIGVVLNGAAKAYPLAALREVKLVQDWLGGEEIEVQYHASGEKVSVHKVNGERLQTERAWWLGWSEFHPRSEIYSPHENGKS